MINISDLPIADISKSDTVRLIPTAYYKPPVLRLLVDDADEEAILAEIEGLTNRRLKAQHRGLPGLDPRELVYGIWGHSYINAAFAYTRTGGNRFNDETRGAWYAGFDDLTAIDEVAYHRTRELGFIGYYEDEVVYQSLLAGFIGSFYDLRNLSVDSDILSKDPAIAYPAGQALARRLLDDGAVGLVYPSVRKRGGTCLVAFHPHLVQSVRPGARWKMTWDGSPQYSVTTE